jgi:hypothetical protein
MHHNISRIKNIPAPYRIGTYSITVLSSSTDASNCVFVSFGHVEANHFTTAGRYYLKVGLVPTTVLDLGLLLVVVLL